MSRINWAEVLAKAAPIVRSYDTGVTLRQLFYRLVAAEILPNIDTAYKTLSAKTAEARRSGEFPSFIDLTRQIHRYQSFDGTKGALNWLTEIYRRNRTENQDLSLYLAVEKSGIVAQLDSWFSDLGIPILALSGYASQTYKDEVAEDAYRQERPAVLLYAGDFDSSGEDIDRDFVERTGCFDEVVRVALTPDQVKQFDLPPLPGKSSDSRAASFVARHGKLLQVEMDALPPETLKELFQEKIDKFWDRSKYEEVIEQEEQEQAKLYRLAEELGEAA